MSPVAATRRTKRWQRSRRRDHWLVARSSTQAQIKPKENPMRIHSSITNERLLAAVESQFTTLDNPGFCIACGVEQGGCEPDAECYQCEACGAHKVYGTEQLLIIKAGIA